MVTEDTTVSLKVFLAERARKLNQIEVQNKPVIYWMSRDQRVEDNWALLYAANWAKALNQEMWVVFNLVDNFLNAPLRHYHFMLSGLAEIPLTLKEKNINFKFLIGDTTQNILNFAQEINAGLIVCDFSPLKIGRSWRETLAQTASIKNIAVHEVDAHNIVPVWVTSQKQEFAARTIRPKIHKLLPKFLTEFPQIPNLSENKSLIIDEIDVNEVLNKLKLDSSVAPVTWIKSGTQSAFDTLNKFIKNISGYSELRNDPNQAKISNLSPFLHYGQISAQRIALEIQNIDKNREQHKIQAAQTNNSNASSSNQDVESFLEELIVRRELSDNFCFYNPNYDKFEGFADWAKKTLNAHREDKREHIYTLEEFEFAQTHDELWNASQNQMVIEGKMHGYMRMYWAKKILEWSESPEQAVEIAIFLNDKYELDGRDPNGYTGVAWSIGGIHDRPWFEREIFGTIRYMNANGAAKKFDTDSSIQKYAKK